MERNQRSEVHSTLWINLTLVGVALCLAVSSYAEQKKHELQPSEEAISLTELLSEVRANNPQIQAARSSYEASEARPSQARSLPDPMIGFAASNMNNPLPFTTIGSDPQSNAGIEFTQEVPFPGKLGLRGQIAEDEAQAKRHEAAAIEAEVVAKVKSAYVEYWYLCQSISVLERSKYDLDELARTAQVRYEGGRGTQQDVLKAHLEASMLEARLIGIELRRLSARAELNAILNRMPESVLGVPQKPQLSPLLLSASEMIELARQRSPALMAKNAINEREKKALDLAQREYYPDLTFGGYYGYSGDNPDMFQVRVGFKVPLYFWSKQSAGIEEAKHNEVRARSEKQAAWQEINAKLLADIHQAQASQKLLQLYDKSLVPQSRMAFESSLRSYESGQVDFLTLLSNLVAARDYGIGAAEEFANYEKAVARIESVLGESLETKT